MEPLLSWVVCGFSVFLLTAGGFLLARALYAPRLHSLAQRARAREVALAEALADKETAAAEAWAAREVLTWTVEPDGKAQGGPRRSAESPSGREGRFDEPTVLPDPVGFFEGTQGQDGAPPLQRISEEEYEISAAAPADLSEVSSGGLDPRDETRQFNLHSSEAMVHFLQRIDELSDENRELKAALSDRDQLLKEKRQEGSGTVQRFADLDATVDKLRQELGRRNVRIKQLRAQLAAELEVPANRSASTKELGLEIPASESPQGQDSVAGAGHIAGATISSLDAPTVQVTQVDEGEFRNARRSRPEPPRPPSGGKA